MAKAIPMEEHRVASGQRIAASGLISIVKTHVVPRMILIVLGAFYFLPLYWMVVNALKRRRVRQYPPTWYPHNLEWANFSRAVDVFPFWTFLKNTSIITVLTVAGVR